ncbi:hypothetical protein [Sulfitobacter donghicola]|uniref:Uncharacterized protein n=1 Tax=Sulfitobacter donghicola DSW-25 = KCTC 12864 = JCM 14565 TaxID=1300350 RepID=A0A073IIB1_9RHOB|nr:hypothetical protein [Sulfitobacter donghicola]KEJ89261.1 hypothetical protein DSW25_09535 [Sulfitobacter donghicola DSW-25 = KCTC 12864 = JCM 14565]KIN69057.1 hypothetical protein Z948_2791 [Sulfitobacter donghicola DSW-25 = KCTC 12864 = JCM 14565]
MSDLASAVFSIVMVGHSLFGPKGPDMLQAALSATSNDVQVQAQITDGAPLKYNWEHSDDAQGIDARVVLPQGTTTDLILTEAIPLENQLRWSEPEIYGHAFASLALAAKADSRVFLQETWHSLKSGTGVKVEYDNNGHIPWRVRLQEDLEDWESIVEMLSAGHDAERIHLIPAGQAMGRLYDEIADGNVPGISKIDVFFDDDVHLSTFGHYFVSMVQYAVLTGASPEGLPHRVKDRYGNAFETPDAELAAVLQRVAREAVEAYQGIKIAKAQNVVVVAEAADPVSPPQPPTQEAAIPKKKEPVAVNAGGGGEGGHGMAIGLAPVTDWAAQQPFLDIMKTARPWLGHLPNQFGGIEYNELVEAGHIDQDGWVRSLPRDAGSVGTLILTDLPAAAEASLKGRYVLRFDGAGVVEAKGRATNIRYGRGEVRFDYTPGPGSVEIRIQRTNASNPVRNISVVREDRLALWEGGAIFNPDWTARLAPFDTLRFMDWMETNNSAQSKWELRPLKQDASWAHHGVPLEVMMGLAGELGKDIWINIPHLADDTYVRNFAQTVREGLSPTQKVYVEYSNEVWNFQFAQTRWADEQAKARWGKDDVGTQFYAMRAAEVARIWSKMFRGAEEQLVNVISSQTGWLGLEENILAAPLVVAEGGAKPVEAFDAYAVTGYFGGILGLEARRDMVTAWLDESLARANDAAKAEGLSGTARQEALERSKYDYAVALAAQELTDGSVSGQNVDTVSDLRDRVWPYHAKVASDAGLDLIMYEGGTHIVGIGAQVDDARLTAFFQHLNYSTQMGALYDALIDGWATAGGHMFNAYADVYVPTKWGSWGALRHLDDSNPRWDALVATR